VRRSEKIYERRKKGKSQSSQTEREGTNKFNRVNQSREGGGKIEIKEEKFGRSVGLKKGRGTLKKVAKNT